MLSAAAQSIADIRGTWVAVRVKPRNEKAMATDLERNGFGFFAPLVPSRDKWGRATHVPPYSLRGLIFAACDVPPHEGYHVPTSLHYFLFDHQAFYGMIQVAQSAQARFAVDLAKIHQGILDGKITRNTSSSTEFAVVGKVCQIRDGAWMNHQVVIERVLPNGRVRVEIETMGSMRSMEIDVHHLEPVAA